MLEVPAGTGLIPTMVHFMLFRTSARYTPVHPFRINNFVSIIIGLKQHSFVLSYDMHALRGHSVVKLQVWRQSRGQYCTLHVVDTVGSQCASSQAHLANRSKNNERMQASRHLLALSRTLSEFAQSSDFTVSDAAPPRPFNARECRLSELVGMRLCEVESWYDAYPSGIITYFAVIYCCRNITC